MSTITSKRRKGRKGPSRALPAPRRVAQLARPVLVATDGSRLSNTAIQFARLIEDRGDWAPEVMTVFEALPVSVGDLALPAPSTQYETALTDSMLKRIQRQLRRYGAASWNLLVEFGRVAPQIVRTARERKVEIIVVGLGRHGVVARLFGAETAARVLRQIDVPVLATHPSARTLPTVAVAAMDFGDSSVRAAREALALLEPPARLHLVHVKASYNTTSFADSKWEQAYAAGVEHEFARVRHQLGARPGIEITTELLTGDAIQSVLRSAQSVGADLIALGSHSQTVVDRLMIGSTPAQLLREARCSVLVAPPEKDKS